MSESVVPKLITDIDQRIKFVGRNIGSLLERDIKLNYLTGQYLAVATGSGRGSVYFLNNPEEKNVEIGFTTWYLAAYETGDWETYTSPYGTSEYSREYYKRRERRNVRASWTGKQGHRPFLTDAIEANMTTIQNLVRAGLTL